MNKPELIAVNEMPDVSSMGLQQPHAALDWVGMAGIHQPLLVRDGIPVLLQEEARQLTDAERALLRD